MVLPMRDNGDASMDGRRAIQEWNITSRCVARAKKCINFERHCCVIAWELSIGIGMLKTTGAGTVLLLIEWTVEFVLPSRDVWRLVSGLVCLVSRGLDGPTSTTAHTISFFCFFFGLSWWSRFTYVVVVVMEDESTFRKIVDIDPWHFRFPRRHWVQLGSFSSHLSKIKSAWSWVSESLTTNLNLALNADSAAFATSRSVDGNTVYAGTAFHLCTWGDENVEQRT